MTDTDKVLASRHLAAALPHERLGLSRERLIGTLRGMILSREVDDRLWLLSRQGNVHFVITSAGHEATQFGCALAVHAGRDYVVPYYRDMALCIALGQTALDMLLHALGRQGDPASGARQMFGHFSSRALRIVSGSSSVGSHIVHAAGLALALKVTGEQDIAAITFFGEGATAEGAWHEGINFAGIHRLPLVLVCENNQYAISVPLRLESAVEDIALKAGGYGMSGVSVDGNDLFAVYEAAKTAMDRARAGGGPSLLECKTYRLRPHSNADDDRKYRSAAEVEAWRARDPIQRLERYMLAQALLTAGELSELRASARAEVDEATRLAEEAPNPPRASLHEHLYGSAASKPAEAMHSEDELAVPSPGGSSSPFGPEGEGPAVSAQAPKGIDFRSGVPAGPVAQASPADALSARGTGRAGSREPPGDGTGEQRMPEKTFIEAIRSALADEMAADARVIVLGEDVAVKGGVFLATDGLLARFGERRVIDMPVAEISVAGVGIGASLHGLLPVAEIQFADYIHPAIDQIINEAAKFRYRSAGEWSCPIVVRAPFGSGVHGGLYHSQSSEALFTSTPGLKVVVPSTPYDAKGLLIAAIRDPDPVIFFEHKQLYRSVRGEVPAGSYTVPIGQAAVRRPGRGLSLFTYGLMAHHSLAAAETVAAEGIDVEVIDLRTLYPLDVPAILASVRKTGKALIVYEDNLTGGVGGEIAALIVDHAFESLDGPVRRLASPDVPATAYNEDLEAHFMLNPEKIAAAIRELAAY